jgi:hypothetical protein
MNQPPGEIMIKRKYRIDEYYIATVAKEERGYLILQDGDGQVTGRFDMNDVVSWGIVADK